MSDVRIRAIDLEKVIAEKLQEYGDLVFAVTNEALGVGEAILIERLKAASPVKTGAYKKGWKGTGKKYKMVRFVGNNTIVGGREKRKGGRNFGRHEREFGKIRSEGTGEYKKIPLSNILEYSTKHGHPHIKETFNSSVGEIAAAIVNEIKKGI